MESTFAPSRMTIEDLRQILDCVSYTVVVLDACGAVLYINTTGQFIFGCSAQSVVGQPALEAIPSLFGDRFRTYQSSGRYMHSIKYEENCPATGQWFEIHACPSPCGLLVCARDITSIKANERVLTTQKEILEMVATGATLENILRSITLMIERQSGDDLCSILLLGSDGKHLHLAAGGSLPDEYNSLIEGIEIGPNVGSCGTAAWSRELVIVEDICVDPRWAKFKFIAAKFDLRACWSHPIVSRDGARVLGTVANYSRRAGPPSEQSLLLLETAARLAQIALEQHATTKRLRKHAIAFHNLHDGIILTDERGAITDMNAAAEHLFGVRREEALGTGIGLVRGEIHPVDAADEIHHTVSAGSSWQAQVCFSRADGSSAICESVVLPLKNPDGHVIGMVGVNHDVTRSKRAEAHLATEVAVTRVLAAARDLDDAIPGVLKAICETCEWEVASFWTLDDRASVLRCQQLWHESKVSPQILAFCDTTRRFTFSVGEGLPGRTWSAMRPMWIIDINKDANFPRRDTARAAGLHGGLAFPVMLDGKVVAVMEFFTRVLRQPDKHLDAMLTVIGGQVGQFMERARVMRDLEAARAAAESANTAKDFFIAVLSHELRTPLTPVVAAAELLENDPALNEGQRDLAAMVHRNVRLEAHLIDDLLDANRIRLGKLSLELSIVDLHAQAREVARMLSSDAAAKQVTLSLDPAARNHYIKADPTRMQQVLWNLLRNALKFTPRGGQVTLSTSNPSPERLLICVCDTGAGIERDVLSRLFTPFEQGGEHVTRHFGGLGLGLAISKGIIDLHHGTISAASDGPGRGATFSVELPVVSPPDHVARKHSPPAKLEAGSAPSRLLLVEDHADTARIMAKLLTIDGYAVTTANDIRTALDLAGSKEFDFVISDIGLPDGSGLDLMRQLLQRKTVRGIALSGYGMEEDVRKSMDAGFMAHLTKPVNVQKLQEVLRQLAAVPQ